MQVLLSIKPEFADKIFEGSKKYEYRRTIFKDKNIKKVVVYTSFPVQKVIGEFEIEKILDDDLKTLWKHTKEFAGISEEFFFNYFTNKINGYAIQIKKTRKYKKALCLRKDFNINPPQSFVYLDRKQYG